METFEHIWQLTIEQWRHGYVGPIILTSLAALAVAAMVAGIIVNSGLWIVETTVRLYRRMTSKGAVPDPATPSQ